MPDRKEYLVSSKQLRVAMVLGSVGIAAFAVVLLVLAFARPQGKFVELDSGPFEAHVSAATADLSGYSVDGDRATIDIDHAIALVAERGVQDPGFYGSSSVAVSDEVAADDDDGGELPDGGALFASVCVACHMANGQGVPAAFPPLAGHAPALYQADRDLPVEIVLFGMMGSIDVSGMTYNGLMPSHAHLSNGEIAAILNFVMTEWGNDAELPEFEAYAASDVSAVRAKSLSMGDVYDAREAAGL